MSKIDELIEQHCPDGVEYKTLGEIACIDRGGNFQKKDFVEEGLPCIHYGQIYTAYPLYTDQTISFVSEETAAKSKKAHSGDVVMAVTSETIEDVCKCVVWLGNGDAAVSGHTAIISHKQNPKYLGYYFQTHDFEIQKQKIAHGTKVIEVTPCALERVQIPVPPMEVQEEIVRVLDSFTELEAELEAELEKRKKQYAYYRDHLLNSEEEKGVKWVTLGDIGTIVTGLSGKSKSDFVNTGNARYATYKNIFDNVALDLSSLEPVVVNAGEKQNELRKGDILFTGSSETPEEVGMTSVLLETPDFPVYLNSFCFALRPKDTVELSADYSKHLMRSHAVRKQIIGTANGVTRFNVSKHRLLKVRIPLPSLEKQKELANTLDQFDVLVNDLSEGLPAEIEGRHKQYEYYRDQLLTFDEKTAA